MNIIPRRWAIEDLVLVAVSVAAITVGMWSSDPPRQMIHCRGADGNLRSYSLPLHDSRLARLRRELQRRKHPGPTTALVLARWRMELATHYAKRCQADLERATAPQATSSAAAGQVMQASFSGPSQAKPTAAAAGVAATEAERIFWERVDAGAAKQLAQARQQIAERVAQAGPPPIVFGAVDIPGKPTEAWITALLLGLLSACLYAEWAYRSPPVEFVAESHQPHAAHSDAIRIEIPRNWIRVHQPADVRVRRVLLFAIVATAIASVAL